MIYEAAELQIVLSPPIPCEEWEGEHKPARIIGKHPMPKLGSQGPQLPRQFRATKGRIASKIKLIRGS